MRLRWSERGEERGQSEARRRVVGVGAERSGGRAIGPTGEVLDAGHARALATEAADLVVGSVLAEQGAAEHDQVGVERSQVGVVELPARQDAGGERLADDVGPDGEAAEDVLRLEDAQVEREAPLAGIDVAVEPGVLDSGFVAMERSNDARRVDAGGRFDPDHGCAVVGHRASDGRSGDDPAEVEDLDSGERASAFGQGHITPSDRNSSSSDTPSPSSP